MLVKLIHEYIGNRVRHGRCVNRKFDTDNPLRPQAFLLDSRISNGRVSWVNYFNSDNKRVWIDPQPTKIIRRQDGLYLISVNKDFYVYQDTVGGQTYEEHVATGVYDMKYKHRAKKNTFPLRDKKTRKQRATYAWVKSCRDFFVRDYLFQLMEIKPKLPNGLALHLDPDEMRLVDLPILMPNGEDILLGWF